MNAPSSRGVLAGAILGLVASAQAQDVPETSSSEIDRLTELALRGDIAARLDLADRLLQPGGDSARAQEEYRLAAEAGSTDAMYALGNLLLQGADGPADPAAAAGWFRRCAERDDVACQLALADLLLRGLGVARDEAEAIVWIRRAAALGSADAMLALGQLYEVGRGVPPDAAQAAAYYRQASEAGQIEATYRLALAYENGTGVTRDDAEAARLFLAAGSEGHPGAQYRLGEMYRQGRGVEQDPVTAYLWLRIAGSALQPGSATGQAVDEALAKTVAMLDEDELAAAQARAEELLAAAPADSEEEPSRASLSGSLFTGLRWQSNANGGPSASLVNFRGNLVPLSESSRPASDVNLFVILGLEHTLDLEQAEFVTGVTTYVSGQRDGARTDNTLIEIDSGPSIDLGETAAGDLSLRPYVIGTYLASDDLTYMWAGGGGVEAESAIAAGVQGSASLQYRARTFRDSADDPNNSEQNGDEYAADIGLSKALSMRALVSASASAYRAIGQTDDESLWSYQIDLRYYRSLDPLLDIGGTGAWLLGFNGSFEITHYDGSDPIVDPLVTRQDEEWVLGSQLSVPLSTSLTGIGIAQYRSTTSNQANFETDNTSVWVGLSWRF